MTDPRLGRRADNAPAQEGCQPQFSFSPVLPLRAEGFGIVKKVDTRKCPTRFRLLFPVRQPKVLTRAFARLTERLGIKNLRFHDLRHDAASDSDDGQRPTTDSHGGPRASRPADDDAIPAR